MNTKILLAILFILNVLLFIIFLFSKHYAPFLMIIHIVSLLIGWGTLCYQTNLLAIAKTTWKEILLVGLLMVIALFVRLDQIEKLTPGMYPDETLVAQWGLELLERPEMPPFVAEQYYHPTPLLYLTGMSVENFGHTMTAIRLPSVLFGVLSIGLFYILLRLFFPVKIAFFGSFLMIFHYTHVILSRLAYEPIPSLFWQIVTLIFFILYWQKKNWIYLMGIALSIGGGMYTYLNFRPFAAFIILFTLFLILKTHWKKQVQTALFFTSMLFVTLMPLLSYVIIDPQGFSGRASEISIFSRHYSSSEFVKELWGNTFRTTVLPFVHIPDDAKDSLPMSGDPNPGKNPSAQPIFDFLTVILALTGFVYLFRQKRKLFWLLLILFAPAFISDILSTEVIPEFHYYGLGHPNALRTSGLIWLILFAATAGLSALVYWGKKNRTEIFTGITILVLIISYWNWHIYFDQKNISPNFYLYNYKYNHAPAIEAATYLNTLPEKISIVNSDLANNGNFQFFINPTKKISSFESSDAQHLLELMQKNNIIVIDVTEKTLPLLNSLNKNELENMGYTITIKNNPFEQPSFVVISKSLLIPMY